MDIIRGRWFGRPETEQAAPPSEPPAVTHDASPKVEPFTVALVQSQAAEEPESVVASGEAVEAPSSGVPVKDAPGQPAGKSEQGGAPGLFSRFWGGTVEKTRAHGPLATPLQAESESAEVQGSEQCDERSDAPLHAPEACESTHSISSRAACSTPSTPPSSGLFQRLFGSLQSEDTSSPVSSVGLHTTVVGTSMPSEPESEGTPIEDVPLEPAECTPRSDVARVSFMGAMSAVMEEDGDDDGDQDAPAPAKPFEELCDERRTTALLIVFRVPPKGEGVSDMHSLEAVEKSARKDEVAGRRGMGLGLRTRRYTFDGGLPQLEGRTVLHVSADPSTLKRLAEASSLKKLRRTPGETRGATRVGTTCSSFSKHGTGDSFLAPSPRSVHRVGTVGSFTRSSSGSLPERAVRGGLSKALTRGTSMFWPRLNYGFTREDDETHFYHWAPFSCREATQFEPGERDTLFTPAETLQLLLWRVHMGAVPKSLYEQLDTTNEPPWLIHGRDQDWPALRLAEMLGVVEAIWSLHEDVDKPTWKVLQPRLTDFLRSNEDRLSSTRSYFSPYCALYFLFCDEYLKFLKFPAVVGLLVFVMRLYRPEWDKILWPVIALFISVWSTLFLEHWKRQSAVFAHQSGFRGVDRHDACVMAPAKFFFASRGIRRAEDVHRVSTSGLSFPATKESVLTYLWTVAAMVLIFFLTTSVMGVLLWLGHIVELMTSDVFLQNAPVVLYLAVVGALQGVYDDAAEWLTHREGHQVYSVFVKSLTVKKAFFQLMNYLGWFLYLAFWVQDIEYLRNQLMVFLACKMLVIPVATDIVIPHVRGKLRRVEPQESNREDKFRREIEDQWGSPTPELSNEYQELAIVFASATFFAGVFPIGLPLSLVHLILSMWSDCYKMFFTTRRMLPHPEDGIVFEAWQAVFEALSVIAVVTNCALIRIVSDCSMLQMVVLEHVLLFFKAYLSYSIPDCPEWLTRQDILRDQQDRISRSHWSLTRVPNL